MVSFFRMLNHRIRVHNYPHMQVEEAEFTLF